MGTSIIIIIINTWKEGVDGAAAHESFTGAIFQCQETKRECGWLRAQVVHTIPDMHTDQEEKEFCQQPIFLQNLYVPKFLKSFLV